MPRRHTLIFYDGHCGLCHGFVRFAVSRDEAGGRFRFAPLQGTTLGQVLGDDQIAGLADSIVVVDEDSTVSQESDAVLAIARELGSGWGVVGRVLSVVPRSLRDAVYRVVARIRHRLFRRPADRCPVVPEALRGRFLP